MQSYILDILVAKEINHSYHIKYSLFFYIKYGKEIGICNTI